MNPISLPRGMKTQASFVEKNNDNPAAIVPGTISWSSDTPTAATVDTNGMITALPAPERAGQATVGITVNFKALSEDGQTQVPLSLTGTVIVPGLPDAFVGIMDFSDPVTA